MKGFNDRKFRRGVKINELIHKEKVLPAILAYKSPPSRSIQHSTMSTRGAKIFRMPQANLVGAQNSLGRTQRGFKTGIDHHSINSKRIQKVTRKDL
mmetsp:Transcript_20853/g.20593  ORF Transcript_20853/g.20593 Transcript_20853/m.20593 type:complete len:96 (+) Transcript_20853:155-442(+)